MRDIHGSPAQTVDRIMALAEELADACTDYRMYKVDTIEHFDKVRADLQSAVEKLALDAERWKWFAEICATGAIDRAEAAFGHFKNEDVTCTKEQLDAAVDAAMQGLKP